MVVVRISLLYRLTQHPVVNTISCAKASIFKYYYLKKQSILHMYTRAPVVN